MFPNRYQDGVRVLTFERSGQLSTTTPFQQHTKSAADHSQSIFFIVLTVEIKTWGDGCHRYLIMQYHMGSSSLNSIKVLL